MAGHVLVYQTEADKVPIHLMFDTNKICIMVRNSKCSYSDCEFCSRECHFLYIFASKVMKIGQVSQFFGQVSHMTRVPQFGNHSIYVRNYGNDTIFF